MAEPTEPTEPTRYRVPVDWEDWEDYEEEPLKTYLFTVPVKWDSDDIDHPLGATPEDLLRVKAPHEVAARRYMNLTYGTDTWCYSYPEELVTAEYRRQYAPGLTIDAGRVEATDA